LELGNGEGQVFRKRSYPEQKDRSGGDRRNNTGMRKNVESYKEMMRKGAERGIFRIQPKRKTFGKEIIRWGTSMKRKSLTKRAEKGPDATAILKIKEGV